MAKYSGHKCSVLGCTDQHKSLHVLPKEEDISNKWMEFVNEGRSGAQRSDVTVRWSSMWRVLLFIYLFLSMGREDQRTVGLMTHRNNATHPRVANVPNNCCKKHNVSKATSSFTTVVSTQSQPALASQPSQPASQASQLARGITIDPPEDQLWVQINRFQSSDFQLPLTATQTFRSKK